MLREETCQSSPRWASTNDKMVSCDLHPRVLMRFSVEHHLLRISRSHIRVVVAAGCKMYCPQAWCYAWTRSPKLYASGLWHIYPRLRYNYDYSTQQAGVLARCRLEVPYSSSKPQHLDFISIPYPQRSVQHVADTKKRHSLTGIRRMIHVFGTPTLVQNTRDYTARLCHQPDTRCSLEIFVRIEVHAEALAKRDHSFLPPPGAQTRRAAGS